MKKELLRKIGVLLVLVLFLNLPLVSALEISNVRAEEITENSAVVKWETDEPASSFVSYGADEGDLTQVGDAGLAQNHSFDLSGLLSSTTYHFKVRSGGVEDDNNGELYLFETPEADVTPPEIEVEIPSRAAGNKLGVEGWTEAGAEVKIYVNGNLRGRSTAEEEVAEGELKGKFTFTGVSLLDNEWNDILIEAEDKSGNVGSWTGNVFADTDKPEIEFEELPELVDGNEVLLKGKISENCSIEILVSNRSVFKGEGNVFEKKVLLQEGKNEIKVIFKDEAGWEVVEEFVVSSDTRPPQVRFDLEKGGEYYQGRAETNINGETEPEADVYLYVYRRLGYEYTPKFDKAWVKITADEEGKFNFKDVDLECTTCGLELLSPKEVPSELLEVSIVPIETIPEVQKWTYHIYVVAEDKTGKTGSAQRTVSVNTCYTANWAFDVQSVAKFQAPLSLDPGLLDEGREVISSWFKLDYHGEGQAKYDAATGREVEPGFKVVSVRFEKACTPGMEKDDAFKVGCKILPRAPRALPNADKTAYFVTWNLHKAEELSKAEDEFWNDFRKRMLMFPLKVMISYRERLADDKWSEVKTQATCYDIGYFVDIPLDSQKMLPDWLVNEGVEGMEWTIERIDTVMPYLEQAILWSGVACITGFLGKMVTRYARIVTSKLETYFTYFKGLTKEEQKEDKKGCPPNQYSLYLESTINGWEKLKGKQLGGEHMLPPGYDEKDEDDKYIKSLEERCPKTAGMWKVESSLDQLYRWSCDRVFCRAVPASWTSEKEEEEIKTVVLKQQRCAVTSAGEPLIEVKDCQKIIEKETVAVMGRSTVGAKFVENNPSYFCYRNADGDLYIHDEAAQQDLGVKENLQEAGVKKLSLVGNIGTKLSEIQPEIKRDILVYRPPGSDGFIVGKDIECSQLCRNPKKPGYKSDGCYTEEVELGEIILKKGTQKLDGNVYSAGYTKDCFIDEQTGKLQQCVCKADEKAEKKYESKEGAKTWLRTAAKEEEGIAEPWSYRQATIFRETKNTVGTYYPELRYYTGRDVSGAFGADHLLDYIGEKEYHEINPNTQHIGAFQSLCLSGIRARLMMLRNILEGLKNCLYEAKYTGLHDAGVCKTIFAQHVCGLIYKVIAYFFTGCSPYSFEDIGKGGAFEDIGAVFEAGFSSIPEAMESSISEIQDDYGNAKLNEFFATGVKGFAQSMCMAAFGFDFPMGFDFIMDAAYAAPMKTTVHVIPAERELATYNPKLGTAIYNYEIGAVVLPGCKIRNYKVYLKCVGVEDAGRPGVECGTQGCDCMNLMSQSSLGAERVRHLEGGIGFEIKQGQPLDVPIPSPQKIDSIYRYDHVVVELQLDRFEEAEACFDEGYRDGKFYFPITDVSAPAEVVCQPNAMTGEYGCPELTEFFGKMGLAYLEEPYVTCWNERTERWVDCETPNLFMLGDRIKVRVHTVTDGKGQCLKATVSGLQKELPLRRIPENIPGPLNIEYSLGTVDEAMLSGVTSMINLVSGESNDNCQKLIPAEEASPEAISAGRFEFYYERGEEGKYKLRIPSGAKVIGPTGYEGADYLEKEGITDFTLLDINSVVFDLGGFKMRNVLGRAALDTTPARCVYQIGGRSGTAPAANYRDLSARFDLMYPDETGGCYYTSQLVKTAVGKNSHTQRIKIQRETMAAEEMTRMHEAFMKGDYDYAAEAARNVIDMGGGDLDDAIAIYYLVAVDVMKWGETGDEMYKIHIKNMLDLFFERIDANGNPVDDYSDRVKQKTEYKKIEKYLKIIKNTLA